MKVQDILQASNYRECIVVDQLAQEIKIDENDVNAVYPKDVEHLDALNNKIRIWTFDNMNKIGNYSQQNSRFEPANKEWNQLLSACLCKIKEELERLYWEKYQKIIENPFEDTGTTYQNKTFTVRAYKKDNNKEPNFETENIKVWWHKSEGKDNYIETTPCFDNPTNYAITLNKCLAALQKDFIADKK